MIQCLTKKNCSLNQETQFLGRCYFTVSGGNLSSTSGEEIPIGKIEVDSLDGKIPPLRVGDVGQVISCTGYNDAPNCVIELKDSWQYFYRNDSNLLQGTYEGSIRYKVSSL